MLTNGTQSFLSARTLRRQTTGLVCLAVAQLEDPPHPSSAGTQAEPSTARFPELRQAAQSQAQVRGKHGQRALSPAWRLLLQLRFLPTAPKQTQATSETLSPKSALPLTPKGEVAYFGKYWNYNPKTN